MGTLFVRQYVCGVEVTTEIKVDVSVLKFRVAVNNWRASLALAVDTSARYSRNVQIFMVEAKENWRSGGFPTTFLSNFATIRIQWEYQATSNYTYDELSIPESLSFLGILMCAFRLCLCKLILIFRFLKKKIAELGDLGHFHSKIFARNSMSIPSILPEVSFSLSYQGFLLPSSVPLIFLHLTVSPYMYLQDSVSTLNPPLEPWMTLSEPSCSQAVPAEGSKFSSAI